MRKTTCIISLMLVLVWASIVAAQQRNGQNDRTKPEHPDLKVKNVKEYVYKKTKQGELKIYVHFPDDWKQDDKRAAIVFFFGGGWIQGSAGQFKLHAEYLATRGMVAARADYRVKNRHGVLPEKCVEDAKSAVRWMRKNAKMLGVDPNRIVAGGDSAGAHIAACAATTTGSESQGEDLSVSSKPNALLLFEPPLALNERLLGRMGGDTEMLRRLAPILYIDENTPPTFLAYGTRGLFFEDGKAFAAKSKSFGNRVDLYIVEGEVHGFIRWAPWFSRTLARADEFLSSLGYIEGPPTDAMPGEDVDTGKKGPARLKNEAKFNLNDKEQLSQPVLLYKPVSEQPK